VARRPLETGKSQLRFPDVLRMVRSTASQTTEILKLCRDLHAQVQSSED
jgi:hypothetical protein